MITTDQSLARQWETEWQRQNERRYDEEQRLQTEHNRRRREFMEVVERETEDGEDAMESRVQHLQSENENMDNIIHELRSQLTQIQQDHQQAEVQPTLDDATMVSQLATGRQEAMKTLRKVFDVVKKMKDASTRMTKAQPLAHSKLRQLQQAYEMLSDEMAERMEQLYDDFNTQSRHLMRPRSMREALETALSTAADEIVMHNSEIQRSFDRRMSDFNNRLGKEAQIVSEMRVSKFRDDIRTIKSNHISEVTTATQAATAEMDNCKAHVDEAVTSAVFKLESKVNEVSDPTYLTAAVDSTLESIIQQRVREGIDTFLASEEFEKKLVNRVAEAMKEAEEPQQPERESDPPLPVDEEARHAEIMKQVQRETSRNLERGLNASMARIEALRVIDARDSIDYFDNVTKDYESAFQTDGEEYCHNGRSAGK